MLAHALRAAGAVPCRLYADDFVFASVDPAVQAIAGIDADTWCHQSFWERHLSPQDKPALEEARRAARAGQRVFTLSFHLVNGDTKLPLRLVGQRLPRASRSQSRALIGGYLLLDAARTAPASAAANAERVESAALDQVRQDLIRTAQLAVAGELVGAITHDLRQPITALQVNLEVAIDQLRKATPDLVMALAALEDASADGIQLRDSVQVLQDLVARRKPSRAPLAIADVIDEVARLLQTEAVARHVVLDVIRPARLPRVSGDPTMLREAVLSLVLDAVENAAPVAGGAHVAVAARAPDDARVELTVSHDRRPGVTVDDAWALSIARSVAEAHGATMLVDVNPQSGVMVRTTWPTLREDVT